MRPTNTSAKYKNCRWFILIVFVMSLLNFIIFYTSDMFYVFSAYTPIMLTTIGRVLTATTGETIYNIMFLIVSILILVPFILSFFLSKKHYAWMIVALVLFSIDTIILMVDTLPLLSVWSFSDYMNLAIHIYVVVMLALGVKYGVTYNKELKAIKEAEENSPVAEIVTTTDGETQTSDGVDFENPVTLRKITVARKKAFVGCAVAIEVYVNDKVVGKLKNGATITFDAPTTAFTLTASFSTGFGAGNILIAEGSTDVNVLAVPKMGLMSNHVVLEIINSEN